MACWNVAHNTGGTSVGLLVPFGIVYLFNGDWVSMFYFPAFLVLGIAGIAWLLLRDTPQSCGLPPIEEYKNDYPEDYSKKHEEELSTWDIFFTYILPNQCLWYVAFANAFVYLVRFGVVTWVPTYLSEVRGYTITKAGFGFATYEIAGIMGTLLCGWLSDRVFRGQRAPACMLFMFLVSFFVCVYWLAPAEHPWLVYASLFAIGFLIYGPVMMIGLYALELAPKKAAGTAAGLTGLFGYMFGTLTANFGIGFAVDHLGGWNAGFIIIIASCFLACFFIGLAWCTKGQTSTQPSAGD